MQLVINMPEELYKRIPTKEYIGYMDMSDWQKIIMSVSNGTPLPKGHGNLFDENDFEKRVAIMTESMDLGYGEIMGVIDEIPTIIEADDYYRGAQEEY